MEILASNQSRASEENMTSHKNWTRCVTLCSYTSQTSMSHMFSFYALILLYACEKIFCLQIFFDQQPLWYYSAKTFGTEKKTNPKKE